MFAYHIPDLTDPRGGMDALKAHPVARRIVQAGRWQLSQHPAGGSLASWVGFPFQPGAYGDPVATHDGMHFLPPKSWGEDAKKTLIRPSLPGCTDVVLDSGTLLVGVASRAPRPRRFAGVPALGAPASTLAEEAFQLWDRISAKEFISLNDAQLSRVLFLAVAACYRVTEEALDSLGWLTTADDDKILCAVFGLDPKAEPGAGGTSPSPLPGSYHDHG